MSLFESQPYRLFFNSLRSAESRKTYPVYLKKYMELQSINDLLSEKKPSFDRASNNRFHNKKVRSVKVN